MATLVWLLKGIKENIVNDSYNGSKWNIMKSTILK